MKRESLIGVKAMEGSGLRVETVERGPSLPTRLPTADWRLPTEDCQLETAHRQVKFANLRPGFPFIGRKDSDAAIFSDYPGYASLPDH
jgi:hypothetical protein